MNQTLRFNNHSNRSLIDVSDKSIELVGNFEADSSNQSIIGSYRFCTIHLITHDFLASMQIKAERYSSGRKTFTVDYYHENFVGALKLFSEGHIAIEKQTKIDL